MATSRCTCPTSPTECVQSFCPYQQEAIEFLGRRWVGAIVRALSIGVLRFSEIRATIPEINDRILSERLKDLEAEGMVQRVVYPETPVRIEYHLTAKGHALQPSMDELSQWASVWLYSKEPEK